MNPDSTSPHRWRPSRSDIRRLRRVGLAPVLGAVLATVVLRIPVVTALVALAGAFLPMVRAQTFIISLLHLPDRSPLLAQFAMMHNHTRPRWPQRWYVPLIGAMLGGAAAELLRTVIFLRKVAQPLTPGVVGGAVGVGAIEGALLVLVCVLGWAIASSALASRFRRAA
jgi:hypothetical protein